VRAGLRVRAAGDRVPRAEDHVPGRVPHEDPPPPRRFGDQQRDPRRLRLSQVEAAGPGARRRRLLRRFVVIDLKTEDFLPEFAGKTSVYLTAVDNLERRPGASPSIGLVLCPGRRKI